MRRGNGTFHGKYILLVLNQGSLNYGQRARCGPRSYFVNDEKIICSTYEKFVDLVEYNISRNNHIA